MFGCTSFRRRAYSLAASAACSVSVCTHFTATSPPVDVVPLYTFAQAPSPIFWFFTTSILTCNIYPHTARFEWGTKGGFGLRVMGQRRLSECT